MVSKTLCNVSVSILQTKALKNQILTNQGFKEPSFVKLKVLLNSEFCQTITLKKKVCQKDPRSKKITAAYRAKPLSLEKYIQSSTIISNFKLFYGSKS